MGDDVGKSFVSSEQIRVKFISNKSSDFKLEFDPVGIKSTITVGKSETTDSNGNESIMSDIPIISDSFGTKRNIKAEIKELLSGDRGFNYVLYNILKIINNIFDEYGNPGRVEVALESDEDNPKWKHADIKIKLDDDSLNSEIWRKASKATKEFYKSTDARKIMPRATLQRIHKFVYIIVD